MYIVLPHSHFISVLSVAIYADKHHCMRKTAAIFNYIKQPLIKSFHVFYDGKLLSVWVFRVSETIGVSLIGDYLNGGLISMHELSELVKLLKSQGVIFRKIISSIDLFDELKTIQFLREYGLPDLAKPLYTIEDIRFFEDSKLSYYPKDNTKVVIGEDSGGFLCLDKYTGCMYSLSDDYYPIMFVNSSIEDFIKCLYVYKVNYDNHAKDITEDDEIAVFHDLTAEFNRIDNRILADPNNWWSQMIEMLSYSEL